MVDEEFNENPFANMYLQTQEPIANGSNFEPSKEKQKKILFLLNF